MCPILTLVGTALKKAVSNCFGSCCGGGTDSTITTTASNTCNPICCSIQLTEMVSKSRRDEGNPRMEPLGEEPGSINVGQIEESIRASTESFQTATDAPLSPRKSIMHSCFEESAIFPLIPMNIGDLYFSFTNPSLFMLLTLSLVLLLVHFVTKNGGGKPKAR